jgi:arsenate reductase
VNEFANQKFDTVITVCDRAAGNCPIFPGAPERIHWSLEDPAAAPGDDEEKLRAFRRTRDDLFERLRQFLSARSAGNSG